LSSDSPQNERGKKREQGKYIRNRATNITDGRSKIEIAIAEVGHMNKYISFPAGYVL